MKRQEYDHTKLQGNDVDIETSLKEYGIAWIETETEYLFYYGIKQNNSGEYIRFDFCSFNKDINIKSEYDWVDDWNDFVETFGYSVDEWMDLPLYNKISDLNGYYGYENVFGSSYWEGLTYDQVIKGK